MNKQDLSAQTKVPGKGVDEILAAMGISKDLPDYTDEHVNFIQAIRDIHKNEGCKSWAEAVGLYRKPINEAELKDIALRYSMSDRIPEITAELKLEMENITPEQFEQFREVCEQVQQNIDLPIAAQGVLNKAKAAKAKPAMPELLSQPEPGGAIAKSERPLPEIVEKGEISIQPVDLSGIPQDGEVIEQLAELAQSGAQKDAIALSDAPFRGVIKASNHMQGQAGALEQQGVNVYLNELETAMQSPELKAGLKERIEAMKPAHWKVNKDA